jgi:hypothetical protein
VSPDGIFSPGATQAQIDKLSDLPQEEGGIGATVTSKGDVGVVGTINRDIGKPGGWFVLGQGSWMRKAGGTVTGWLKWKGAEPK